MKNLLSMAVLFTGILSVIFAFSFFIKKTRRTPDILMAFLFLCWGIVQIRIYLLFSNLAFIYPFLFILHFPIISLIAPLVYLNVKAVFDAGFVMNIRKCAYFIFPLLLLLTEIIIISANPADYFNSVRFSFSVLTGPRSSEILQVLLVIIITGCIYNIFFEIFIIREMLALCSIQELNVKKRFLIIIISISIIPLTVPQIIFIIGFLTGSREYLLYAISIISAVVLFLYFMMQRNAEIPQDLLLIRRKKYKRSLLADKDTEELRKHITELMENEKAYADETITLRSLAEKLRITPHQLSELLNEHLNISFNNFINRYRIEEAKKALAGSDLSVLEIAYKVGFNAKSAFNTAFRRFTGTTPVDFRKAKN